MELTSEQIAAIRKRNLEQVLLMWASDKTKDGKWALRKWLTIGDLLDTLDAREGRIETLEEALTKLVNAYHGLYVANQLNCGRETSDEEIENIPVIKGFRKALAIKEAQDGTD